MHTNRKYLPATEQIHFFFLFFNNLLLLNQTFKLSLFSIRTQLPTRQQFFYAIKQLSPTLTNTTFPHFKLTPSFSLIQNKSIWRVKIIRVLCFILKFIPLIFGDRGRMKLFFFYEIINTAVEVRDEGGSEKLSKPSKYIGYAVQQFRDIKMFHARNLLKI